MTRTLLTLGHGYCAQALAHRLMPLGWTVMGTTRSAEKAEEIAETGVRPVMWEEITLRAALAEATHVLVSASPRDGEDPSIAVLGDALRERAPALDWVGYLSTTGVYGDHDGGWVDESTPLEPSTERGQLRVMAEREWQSIPGLPLHIFRIAGIYGPGRGPFAKVRRGTARRLIKPGQVFSRIHVEDIAQVLHASIEHPNPGAAYNVCDDDPAPPQDVIALAADLLGVERPPEVPLEEADMSPMARSFYAENKRVSNARIKDELGVGLKYPDYRVGLRALLEAEGD
ncbi:SDR family oxidoreductase [Allosediminivita pacifica]|uniref:Nucleoside-diphosphate-sugar epimerase n=1 Tax=Allosediminivita pacifica TaxID=1267769 RepID=A0A2T6B9S9_9RHOB|nr:SDR family oxidoreductase [Allosediminivita pacifica]PTX52830.1 nucleoside-diphosphate-sugar epimerase [Allosediminivita pacifica]